MENRKPQTPVNFGQPLDPEYLENFAEVDAIDMESAIEWFDENASPEWAGALENKPIGKRKK
jgi:hypothetical protein